MAKLNLNSPRQRTPTVDTHDNPSCCFVCGMRAVALSIAPQSRSPKDPQYICKRCAVAIEDYSKIRRLDDFELAALDGGVDAIGEWIATHGVTDLSHYDDLMQRMMVKAAWLGCVQRLRELLNADEAPF